MITLLVGVLVICALVALIWWAVPALGVPQPLARVVTVGSVVLAFIFILLLVLQAFGIAVPSLR
jgi:hypothetical protein